MNKIILSTTLLLLSMKAFAQTAPMAVLHSNASGYRPTTDIAVKIPLVLNTFAKLKQIGFTSQPNSHWGLSALEIPYGYPATIFSEKT